MRENARKLGEIRKLCSKVAVIRNMGQQPPGVVPRSAFGLIAGLPATPTTWERARAGRACLGWRNRRSGISKIATVRRDECRISAVRHGTDNRKNIVPFWI